MTTNTMKSTRITTSKVPEEVRLTELQLAQKKLAETRRTANEAVAGDPRTRPGREMQKRQAGVKLPDIKKKFDEEFKKAATPVFVVGPNAKSFIKAVEQELDVMVPVDMKDITADIRGPIQASVGTNREFGVTQFTIFLREVRQLGVSLGLTSIPVPTFVDTRAVPTADDLDKVIDDYLYKNFNPEFFALALEQRAAIKAETLDLDAPAFPVFITGVPADMVEKLGPKVFSGRYRTVSAPEVVNEQTVIAALKEVATLNAVN